MGEVERSESAVHGAMRGERGPELVGIAVVEVLDELAERTLKRPPPSPGMRLAYDETARLAQDYHRAGDYLRAALTLQKLAAEVLRLQVQDERAQVDELGTTEPAPKAGGRPS